MGQQVISEIPKILSESLAQVFELAANVTSKFLLQGRESILRAIGLMIIATLDCFGDKDQFIRISLGLDEEPHEGVLQMADSENLLRVLDLRPILLDVVESFADDRDKQVQKYNEVEGDLQYKDQPHVDAVKWKIFIELSKDCEEGVFEGLDPFFDK